MEILKQSNTSYYGNDCMIYRDIALLEAQRNYIVLDNEKVTGWSNYSSCTATNFTDYNDANRFYNKLINGEE